VINIAGGKVEHIVSRGGKDEHSGRWQRSRMEMRVYVRPAKAGGDPVKTSSMTAGYATLGHFKVNVPVRAAWILTGVGYGRRFYSLGIDRRVDVIETVNLNGSGHHPAPGSPAMSVKVGPNGLDRSMSATDAP